MRLSRAEKIIYPHLDVDFLRRALERAPRGTGLKVIVTESLFSMDGDCAPLRELADLAKAHDAYLIVDEAHATGLWGRFDENLGGGMAQSLGLGRQLLATVHTGGKALGCGGAWVACSAELKSYLINFCRPFIFSTAPMPMAAVALRETIAHWLDIGQERVAELFAKIELFKTCVNERVGRPMVPPSVGGPIVPLIFGPNDAALQAARRLQALGFDIRAIRPPTVAEGTARLRVTIRSDQTLESLRTLVEALSRQGVPA